MIDAPDDLIPQKFRAYARQLAVTEPVYAPTPFPPDAAAYYVSGGCWNLAIALHTATGGLPIEALFRDGRPKHAVVVDGATTLDALGRRLLRHARASFDEWRDLTPDGLVALLVALPDGAALMECIEDADVQLAAERAARFVIDAAA